MYQLNQLSRLELETIIYALDQSAIVAITDKSGMILYVNDKFTQISQYSREELVGKTHRLINSGYHPKEYMKHLWQTILAGKVWRGELKNRAKDGSYYWVDTTITPIVDEQGKPKLFIAIRTDITERKLLEQQKDEFIGIASHELKTPVTSLKAYLQLAAQTLAGERHPMALLVNKAERQTNKLIGLITDLLDITKIDSGQINFHKQPLNVNEVIREAVDAVQVTALHHRIETNLSPPAMVLADKNRLSQVVQNLLTNAIKYSPESDKVMVESNISDGHAVVKVQDFGLGINPSEQSNIFQKFYRTNSHSTQSISGNGLGLYISSQIIAHHHGNMWVDSQPGKGSSFFISLPLTHRNPLAKPAL